MAYAVDKFNTKINKMYEEKVQEIKQRSGPNENYEKKISYIEGQIEKNILYLNNVSREDEVAKIKTRLKKIKQRKKSQAQKKFGLK